MSEFVKIQIMGTALDVTDRYSDLKALGVGASGLICSAYDSKGKRTVAIKKIAKPFENGAVAKRTYREVHLMSNLRHDNLINMQDIFISPAEDLYLVMDCISTDLHHLIQTNREPLERKFTQFFTYQMLRGLKYIHSAGIIHRDLKPSNLLINENCDLKICDFGLAREQDHQMTGYVTTRYYRAPEIMLTWQKYTYAVDIWSVGCILAEMISGKVLFPGKDHVHQFTLIKELLGKPPKELMQKVFSENVWPDCNGAYTPNADSKSQTLQFVENLPDSEPRPLTSVLGDVDPQAVDLLEKMLVFDPEKRITVTDALAHPYVSTYQDPDDEPVFSSELDWSFLDAERSADEWKSKMYFEILDFHQGACDFPDNVSPTTKHSLKVRADEIMGETY